MTEIAHNRPLYRLPKADRVFRYNADLHRWELWNVFYDHWQPAPVERKHGAFGARERSSRRANYDDTWAEPVCSDDFERTLSRGRWTLP